MNMKEIDMKWQLKKIVCINLSIRTRVDIQTNKEEEYAVIQVIPEREVDLIVDETRKKHRRKKFLSLMCFIPGIYTKIQRGNIYSFSGFVSWGYGCTYFCVKECFDLLGIPIQSESSEFFAPPEKDET